MRRWPSRARRRTWPGWPAGDPQNLYLGIPAGTEVIAGLVLAGVFLIEIRRRLQDRRQARRGESLRGRCISPVSDLDEEAQAVWRRVTAAAVMAADAARACPTVDGIEVRAVLGEERWQIGELAAQTRLRRAAGGSGGKRDRDLAAAVASTLRRVGAVEGYARQQKALAAAADEAECDVADAGPADRLPGCAGRSPRLTPGRSAISSKTPPAPGT